MKNKNIVKKIAEISMMAALAFALDALQGGIFRGLFPNGGSIGFAMLPILVLTYRRGFKAGFCSALIMSFLQMMSSLYIQANVWHMAILQILLDYILAYPLVAASAIFVKKYHSSISKKEKVGFLIAGSVLGGLCKLLSHYLAGIIFWQSSCPEGYVGGPTVFSLIYNGSYMLPNIIINTSALVIIGITQPKFLFANDGGTENEN